MSSCWLCTLSRRMYAAMMTSTEWAQADDSNIADMMIKMMIQMMLLNVVMYVCVCDEVDERECVWDMPTSIILKPLAQHTPA